MTDATFPGEGHRFISNLISYCNMFTLCEIKLSLLCKPKNRLFILVLGVVPPNMFDRLQAASFLGGYNASISGNMPAMSHYVTTGMDPFVAVYTAVEVWMFFKCYINLF